MIRKQGFVAMLDVLGFSDQVSRDSQVGTLDKYVDTVLATCSLFDDLKVILFSDTVVLYTGDDSPHSFEEIVKTSSRLLYSLLKQEIAIRGAIAHGSFARSDNDAFGAVIAGPPIIEAYRFEAQQQWVGIALAASVLRHIPNLIQLATVTAKKDGETESQYFERLDISTMIQRCHAIPVEPRQGTAGVLDGYAIVPSSMEWINFPQVHTALDRCVKKLEWLKQLAQDPRSQAKYANMIRFLQEVYSRWMNLPPAPPLLDPDQLR